MVRLCAKVIGKNYGLLLDKVNEALKTAFAPDWNLYRHRYRTQTLPNHGYCTPEVGANAVHLIDETYTRDIILVRLAPYRFGLWFNACDGIKDDDSAIQDAQRALNLSSKVDMSRRIDDVDAMIEPKAGGSGRRNGNAAFLLLGHPVHRSCPFMHLTHTVYLFSVEEDALGRSCFASVYVSNNTNISGFFEWVFSSHDILLPAIMSEGFIRLRHFVGLLAFLNGHALSGSSVHQFASQFFSH